ncbi:uncharacterized protein LOC141937119 isoform X2 [Strix uralensis]|uniref:uncharacterized protein LOC141937119 isoform X2 n=1 Tax=Strix uralensis TaxID=36305 RepID=UPI003DA6ED32
MKCPAPSKSVVRDRGCSGHSGQVCTPPPLQDTSHLNVHRLTEFETAPNLLLTAGLASKSRSTFTDGKESLHHIFEEADGELPQAAGLLAGKRTEGAQHPAHGSSQRVHTPQHSPWTFCFDPDRNTADCPISPLRSPEAFARLSPVLSHTQSNLLQQRPGFSWDRVNLLELGGGTAGVPGPDWPLECSISRDVMLRI